MEIQILKKYKSIGKKKIKNKIQSLPKVNLIKTRSKYNKYYIIIEYF